MKKKVIHRIVKGTKQKLCPSCKKWKSLDLFNKSNRQLDGLHGHCKKCRTKQDSKYRQKYKDLCFAQYGGYKCATRDCNVTDPRGLTLDHINDDGAKMGHRTGWRFYRWLVLNNFPSEHKLQVLCGTHQLIKEKERRKKEREKRMKNL